MLVIRLQRTGRKGHAMFRIVVQDSRRTPSSGKVVANVGNYDPHAKSVVLDKEKIQFYLDHGAQPSERVVTIISKEGIKLPEWVKSASKKERSVRNPEKRRSTSPEEPQEEIQEAAEETTATEAPSDETATESQSDAPETPDESGDESKPAEEPASQAEETKAESK